VLENTFFRHYRTVSKETKPFAKFESNLPLFESNCLCLANNLQISEFITRAKFASVTPLHHGCGRWVQGVIAQRTIYESPNKLYILPGIKHDKDSAFMTGFHRNKTKTMSVGRTTKI
jgi:hypothetical protein